jgi:hypothetical protein
MNISSARLPVLLLGLAAAACSSDRGGDGGSSSGDCDLLAGDLVITEVMANPAGQDTGQEYFEVYNASSETIDAAGLTLVYSLADGSDEETHEVEELSIEPGDYVTMGGADPEALPDFIGYGFASDLGALRNGGAVLALRCGDDEIDRVEYPSAEGDAGVAWSLDGAITPDHLVNDDPASFCGATIEFAEGMFGTPGEANESCTPAVVPGSCTDEDGERDVVVPVVGDLVISEHMASPNGTDNVREWFEVYAATDVDLNGVTVWRDDGEPAVFVETADCVRLAAGEYAVLARSDDAGENGGLPEVAGTFGFTLVADAVISIGVGEEVLDQVALTPVTEDSSTALDPEALDPTANDDVANWFTCEALYGDDKKQPNTGTPGASNEACGDKEPPPPPPPDSCIDGGESRPIVPPGPGDLRISEYMANPDAVSDAAGEWFEVQVLADVDLNGLQIGQTSDPYDADQTLGDKDNACISVSAGDFIVFAVNTTAGANGGIAGAIETSQTLSQGVNGDRLFIGFADEVIDEVSWGAGEIIEGAATSLDPGGDVFCPAVDPYGAGDLGTPGEANPACP